MAHRVRSPGFWLLRSPGSKLSPAILLLYAALVAILLATVIERFSSRRSTFRRASLVAAVAGVVGTLAYPFPLWNGSQVRTGDDVFSARQLEVPRGWEDAAQHLNASSKRGKVLQLPLLDYYQAGTTWGYYCVDSIAGATVERPVLQRLRGSYLSPSEQFDQLLGAVDQAISAADTAAVPGLLRALGVSQVLVRRDFEPVQSARRDLTPPGLLEANGRTTMNTARRSNAPDILRANRGRSPLAPRGMGPPHDRAGSEAGDVDTGLGTAPVAPCRSALRTTAKAPRRRPAPAGSR